jgi:hypothetical protein
MAVNIPLLPPLVEALKAGPTADLAFVCGANSKPMTKEGFGNAFRVACRKAGVDKSAHGLCKIGATRAADNGATTATLNAIFGWTGSKMASLYTQNADRKRLAREHIGKLLNVDNTGTDFPAREGMCGKKDEKPNDNKRDFFRWWAVTDSNRRHPACKAGALPAELTALRKPIAPDDAVAQ